MTNLGAVFLIDNTIVIQILELDLTRQGSSTALAVIEYAIHAYGFLVLYTILIGPWLTLRNSQEVLVWIVCEFIA